MVPLSGISDTFIIPHFVHNLLQHFFDFLGVCARVIATFFTGFLHLLLHLTFTFAFDLEALKEILIFSL